MQVSLSNKVAVVTGGSSGIGQAIAERLLEAGCIVINADMQAPLQQPLQSYHFIPTDLRNVEQVQHLYHEALALAGKPDMLIACAGKGIHEKISEGDPEKWQELIQSNVMSLLRFLRAFLPALLEKNGGDIVIISSLMAGKIYEYGGIYSASKAAVTAIAENLRMEVKENARVTTIFPGVVNSGFFEKMEGSNLSIENIGLGAIESRQVADAVIFALTRESNHVISDITLRPIRQYF